MLQDSILKIHITIKGSKGNQGKHILFPFFLGVAQVMNVLVTFFTRIDTIQLYF